MIRRILVAFDGSPSSEAALSIAGSLAGLTDAELIGLFVEDQSRFMHISLGAAVLQNAVGEPMIPMPLPPEDLIAAEEEVEEESKALYELFQDRCQTAKVRGRFLSLHGIPEEVISGRAKSVDFVVLGNCGRSSLQLGFQHSAVTVNGLLRATTRPVLVVPEEALGESRLVIAYDGSAASERALRAAAEFAEISEMEAVHLFTIAGSDEEALEIQSPALEYLTAYGLEVIANHEKGRVGDEILRYADQVDASVIALGAFGANRIREAIFGSTTDAVLKGARAAVLLVA